MDENRLANVPLFAALSKAERRRIAQVADEVDLREGKQLMGEGAFAYEFFLIESGSAEVRRGDQHVADLGPGDFFGEMGAIEDIKRNATVTTSSPMTAIVMTARDFRRIAAELPAVAEQIQAAIAERSKSLTPLG